MFRAGAPRLRARLALILLVRVFQIEQLATDMKTAPLAFEVEPQVPSRRDGALVFPVVEANTFGWGSAIIISSFIIFAISLILLVIT